MVLAIVLMLLVLSGASSSLGGPCSVECNAPDLAEAVATILPSDSAQSLRSDPAGSLNAPSIGIGLSAIADYASQMPFLDLMKSARPWSGNTPGEWGKMSFEELKEGGYLDDDGWPLSIPPGITSLATLVLTDLPAEAISANGRYRLRYEGQGLVEISSDGKTIEGRGGEAWFTAKVGEGSTAIISIIRTDPNGVGEHLRNFTIVKEENVPAYEAGEIFNPLWIDRIKDMRELRFMDWMATNNSLESEWADRPEVTDFTYGRHGVPLEIMVRLANEVGADPWFNIPHLATDDYIRNFATVVRDSLDPRLKAHVELSNEVWNWQFSQADWAEQKGLERWGRESTWVQYYGLRASQMAAIWDEVYGSEAEGRLLKIISTHTGWKGLEEDILNAALWVAEAPGNRPPYTYFDAYAITGYFSGNLGGDEKAPVVLDWINDSRKRAVLNAESQRAEHRASYIEIVSRCVV